MYGSRGVARLLASSRLWPGIASKPSMTVAHQRFAAFSGSITYSGGQATEGQGGYYGSGGARGEAAAPEASAQDTARNVLAVAADVERIATVMREVERLEGLLSEADDENLPVRASIKKTITQPEFVSALNRLEVNGEPAWGLTWQERDMIMAAREKMNES